MRPTRAMRRAIAVRRAQLQADGLGHIYDVDVHDWEEATSVARSGAMAWGADEHRRNALAARGRR